MEVRLGFRFAQALRPTMELNPNPSVRTLKVGGAEQCLTSARRKDQEMILLMETVWILRKEELALPYDVCPILSHYIIMNIISWNCRGVLKSSF